MSEVDSLTSEISTLLGTILADREQLRPADGLDTSLWTILAESGLVDLSAEPSLGWRASLLVVRQIAAAGVRVPIAEHDLLAGWLCTVADLPRPVGRATVALLDQAGHATGVPWANGATAIMLVDPDGRVASATPDQVVLTPGWNMAGEGRDALTVTGTPDWVSAANPSLREQVRARGALIRAAQMTAAAGRAVQLMVDHAVQREQFGRPIVKFQAVQQLIADAASEAELGRIATDWALDRVFGDRVVGDSAVGDSVVGDPGDGGPVSPNPGAKHLVHAVAVARSCAGQAAAVIARNAHQVHGAIGTTAEHDLHRVTVPLLAWRAEFGSQAWWERQLLTLLADSSSAERTDLLLPQVPATDQRSSN